MEDHGRELNPERLAGSAELGRPRTVQSQPFGSDRHLIPIAQLTRREGLQRYKATIERNAKANVGPTYYQTVEVWGWNQQDAAANAKAVMGDDDVLGAVEPFPQETATEWERRAQADAAKPVPHPLDHAAHPLRARLAIALEHAKTAPAGELIVEECLALAELLLAKNLAYGNSVVDPVRIFSKVDAIEQINVRIDDKLSRLVRGEAAGEDVVKDLVGYLVMRSVLQRHLDGAGKAVG